MQLDMFALLILSSVGLMILKFIWNRLNCLRIRSEMGLKGPPAKFWTGNLTDLKELREKTNNKVHRGMQEWFQKYGKVYGLYFGPRLAIQCTDIDIMREILIKKNAYFTDRFHTTMGNEPPVSKSLLDQRGLHWKQSRNLVTPAFSGKKMREMSCMIEEKTEIMIEELHKLATKGDVFNIYDNYQALTLDVIGRCAFALDTDCQRDFTDPFYVNCREMISNADIFRSWLNILTVVVPEIGPLFTMVEYRKRFSPIAKAERWLVNSLYKVVQARKLNIKDFAQSVDILQLLLKEKSSTGPAALEVSLDREEDTAKTTPTANEKSAMNESNKNGDLVAKHLTNDEIVGNCYAFMLAGYETTSTSLATTSWLLAKHQLVQQKLIEEVDRILVNKTIANYADVKNMPYMDAVFKESLRFYPPVQAFCTRTCVEECWVAGMKFVPEVQITFPIWQIHHDPSIWDDPEKFDPNRFVNGQAPSHPMAWVPFGGGPRNCVGMRFADMEFKIALASLLKKFTLHFENENEPDLEQEINGILNKPLGGKVDIILRERIPLNH